MSRRRLAVLLIAFATVVVTQSSVQAERRTFTAIYVKDMHCSTCAKKIASKLYAVSGVLEVRANVEKDVAFVTPQRSKSLSPKALWTAVEQAGHVVVKLSGPAGVFTTKPTR